MHLRRTRAYSVEIFSGSRFAVSATLCALLIGAAGPLILSGFNRGPRASDQERFHLPTVEQFARQWPHLDLSNYRSATTPGYHIVVAAADHYLGSDLRLLRLVGLLFTLGMATTLGAALASRVPTAAAVALALPLICSPYVFDAAVWILPDNAGWFAILALILLALNWRDDGAHYACAAIVMVLAVLARQIDIWGAALLWAAVWLGPRIGKPRLNRPTRLGLIILCTVPAALTLAYFVRLWHGFVPPLFQPHGGLRVAYGLSCSAGAFLLALFGLFGPFFLAAPIRRLAGQSLRPDQKFGITGIGLVLGAVIGVLPRTSYSYSAGRFSALWNIVHKMPVICNRSPLIVALAAIGGGVVVVFCQVLDQFDRLIFLAALFLFGITQFFNANAWQRYFEPLVLMLLGIMSARAVDAETWRTEGGRELFMGPVLLSIILAAVTIGSMR